jgi:hypothetical protein
MSVYRNVSPPGHLGERLHAEAVLPQPRDRAVGGLHLQ